MKALVVYDSVYGNTEKIALAIGHALGDDVKVIHAGEVNVRDMESIDLLVLGAPTQGGRATPPVREFLKELDATHVGNRNIAAFDTRISKKWVGIFGYAAGRIARELQKLGGNLVVDPEGFFVQGTEGPLKEGETERAAEWARALLM